MRLEWIILHPATLHAMLAVSLSMCLFLFVSLKRDLWRAERRWKSRVEALEASLQANAQALDERWNELSQASTQPAPPAPLRSAMNQTKRSQVLQMLRRGVAPDDIATTLSLPLNEVELLVKVNEIALSGPAES
jgi:hypothetical protein